MCLRSISSSSIEWRPGAGDDIMMTSPADLACMLRLGHNLGRT
jgi:hypothetical protein